MGFGGKWDYGNCIIRWGFSEMAASLGISV